MMAGTGVSVGGAGMLRTRRRDVSVKPNRKLDRKSSRGMIYENEELRLRTIHINAEVEQGQNDIKKLRRENEQLRREIWSLRDEYDKLEEILKRQKSREESEDYDEDHTDEDDGLQSDYSFDEEEDVCDDDEDGQDACKRVNKSEQLENAENQKISTEKMNSSLHRLHVDFDDLSVVDEEEELKKDKEKVSSEDGQQSKEEKSPPPILKPRHLHENIPFYPGTYEPPTAINSSNYYSDCPFKFPSTANLMMPSETTGMVSSPCTRLHTDPLLSLPFLSGPDMDHVGEQMLHAPPVGWQNNIVLPQKQATQFGPAELGVPPGMQAFGGVHQEQVKQQQLVPTTSGYSNYPTMLQRRNVGLKQSGGLFDTNPFGGSNAERMVTENGWGLEVELSSSKGMKGQSDSKKDAEGSFEKPRHFFAPLPSKLKRQGEQSSPTISHFETATSSSSGKTESTVVSKNHYMLQKGSADVYVNGAIPSEEAVYRCMPEQRTFLSTENLLITDDKSGAGNQLTKSMSCQDLASDSQNPSIDHAERIQQMLTQSDNTLDTTTDIKPFKSHISVTLRKPRLKQAASPETPEIPKLPSIDYRLFKNPFLRTFDPACGYADQNNVTRPLSVQVNDDSLCYYPPQPDAATFHRGVHPGDRYKPTQADQSRLLIPSTQLANGKVLSPPSKHEIQVTSFEKPSPHTLIGPPNPYEFNTLRRLNANPYLQSQNLYQNMPFAPRGGGLYPQRGMMFYDSLALKVPVQTQTSIDGDSHHEDEQTLSHEESAPSTPSGQCRRRLARKEKSNLAKDAKALSPAAQRRLKKQSSVTSSEVPESPGKAARKRHRRLSITTTTTSEGQEDKHGSRSSSSGQDSPKKDQVRRVSLYFNAKKRPSLASVKTARSGSLELSKEKDLANSSERERTNSVSSREIAGAKSRKTSTSSGNLPWCACWGNGCL